MSTGPSLAHPSIRLTAAKGLNDVEVAKLKDICEKKSTLAFLSNICFETLSNMIRGGHGEANQPLNTKTIVSTPCESHLLNRQQPVTTLGPF